MSDERIQCESCNAVFEPLIEKRTDGDLEFVFFRCPFCGARYTISVTDPPLREQIREYTELAEEGRQRRFTESQYLYLEKLLEDNVARSKELRKRYGGVD